MQNSTCSFTQQMKTAPTKLLSIYNDAMKELEEANEKNAEERRSLIGHC